MLVEVLVFNRLFDELENERFVLFRTSAVEPAICQIFGEALLLFLIDDIGNRLFTFKDVESGCVILIVDTVEADDEDEDDGVDVIDVIAEGVVVVVVKLEGKNGRHKTSGVGGGVDPVGSSLSGVDFV